MSIVSVSRYLFYIALLAITWLAVVPQEEVILTTGWDKANHLLAFFVLLGLLDSAYPALSLWPEKLISLFLYAVLIELAQAVVPGRDASLLDIVADCLGLVAYTLVRPLMLRVISSIAKPDTD